MKKPLIGAAIVAILALVVWASLSDSKPRGTKVDTQAAELRTVSSRVKATGEITPEKKVEISAKVVGEIIDLPVVEGQQVSAGQLLVEIERDLYEGARDQAQAALRQAEVSSRRIDVQLADARRNLNRVRELYRDNLVSQDALEQAQLAVDTAEVELQAQVHTIEQYQSGSQTGDRRSRPHHDPIPHGRGPDPTRRRTGRDGGSRIDQSPRFGDHDRRRHVSPARRGRGQRGRCRRRRTRPDRRGHRRCPRQRRTRDRPRRRDRHLRPPRSEPGDHPLQGQGRPRRSRSHRCGPP